MMPMLTMIIMMAASIIGCMTIMAITFTPIMRDTLITIKTGLISVRLQIVRNQAAMKPGRKICHALTPSDQMIIDRYVSWNFAKKDVS